MSNETARYELAITVGEEANRQGKWQHALVSFQAAIDGLDDDPRPHAGLGDTYLGLGDLEQALISYEKAARRAPQNADFLDKIADVSHQLGDEEEAARAAVLAGDVYWHAKAYDQALERWQRAGDLNPNYAGPHERLAMHYRQQGDEAATIHHYLELARILQAQDRRLAALHVCTSALQLAPDNAQVELATDKAWHFAAARNDSATQPGQVRPGDLVEAAGELAQWQLTAAFRQGTLDTPNDERLERNILLGQALLNEGRGRAGQAISCYEQVISGGFHQPAAFFVLGLLYGLVGRAEDATAALALSTQDPFYRRAVALLES